MNRIQTEVPVPGNLTETQADAAVGRVLCSDHGNDRYKVGGDATTAAGNDLALFYVDDIDMSKTVFTVTAMGIIENVVIKDAIDISADGPYLSFDANGDVGKWEAGENKCMRLVDMIDVAAGAKARVFFDPNMT